MNTFDMVRSSLAQLTLEELKALKGEINLRLGEMAAELDSDYLEKAIKEKDDSITLEAVRKSLTKVKEPMSDMIISSREDRF